MSVKELMASNVNYTAFSLMSPHAEKHKKCFFFSFFLKSQFRASAELKHLCKRVL